MLRALLVLGVGSSSAIGPLDWGLTIGQHGDVPGCVANTGLMCDGPEEGDPEPRSVSFVTGCLAQPCQ
eukprot:gene10204-9026_t